MSIENFLSTLHESGITIRLQDEQLKIHAPKEVMSNDILEGIKVRKRDIIDYLRSVSDTGRYGEIKIAGEQEYYELSHAQRRLWVLDQLDPGQPAYNISVAYLFEGRLEVEALKNAFQYLISRHEILRTIFVDIEGQPKQKVLKPEEHELPFLYTDLSRYEDREIKIEGIASAEATFSFSLSCGPLIRIHLLRLSEDRHVFILTMHHIISDGWSMEVLTQEVLVAYENFRNDMQPSLAPLRIQYKDYAEWQHRSVKGNTFEMQRNYWQQQLQSPLPVLDLPPYKKRPAIQTYNGDVITYVFSSRLTQSLNRLSREQDATMFMVLIAILNVLFYKYTGQTDIVLGTSAAGRDTRELEGQIGFYLNTLALRNRFSADDNFKSLLFSTKSMMLKAYDHSLYPFDSLVEDLSLSRDMSRSAIFDVLIEMQNFAASTGQSSKPGTSDVKISAYNQKQKISQLDLTLAFSEADGELGVTAFFNTDLFSEPDIRKLISHFEMLAENISARPQECISSYNILLPSDRLLIQQFTNTDKPWDGNKTMIDILREQVLLHPAAVALAGQNEEITYNELWERSDKIACSLQKAGLHKEEPVAVMCRRSVTMPVFILGILKAAGVYMPVSENYPQRRLIMLLKTSKAGILVTEAQYINESLLRVLAEQTVVRTIFCIDQLMQKGYSSNLFSTHRFAAGLVTNAPGVVTIQELLPGYKHDLVYKKTLYRNKDVNATIHDFIDYLKDNVAGGDHGVVLILENVVYKIIAIRALQYLQWPYQLIDPELEYNQKQQLIASSGHNLIISESACIDETDAALWYTKAVQHYILMDRYEEADQDPGREEAYRDIWEYQAEKTTEAINDYGWINSYTNEPFSILEMEQYIENFSKKLAPYLNKSSKVLEMGCGHGLVAFNMAPLVSYYQATDLSARIIEKNRVRAGRDGFTNLEFTNLSAREISKVDKKSFFDVVVCSSAIHYFPNTIYLRNVIASAIELVSDHAIIYLDDIPDLSLKDDLVASCKQYNKDNKVKTAKENWDNDLFVHKDFFIQLQAIYSEITKVEFSGKLGAIKNELTNYRYDVCITIDKSSRKALEENISNGWCLEFDCAPRIERRKIIPASATDLQPAEGYVLDATDIDQSGEPWNRVPVSAADLSYIIYTSGSTGLPKGAMIEHRGMLNHLYSKMEELGLNERSVIAQNASYTFDISVWQMFCALLAGGRTVVYDDDVVFDTDRFIESIHQDRITVLEVVPSYLEAMLEALERREKAEFPLLEYVLVTGETLKGSLVNSWFKLIKDIPLVNAYGPTEASDDITHHKITAPVAGEFVPIGRPVRNMRLYIVDQDGLLCAPGVKGEIWVSGVGVGRGYIHDTERTMTVFMEDPFCLEKGVRMYKTGDIGRYGEDGVLEYYGRKDDQVKIRGHRIELGEIEMALQRTGLVKQTVVIVREDNKGDKTLVGYVVPEGIFNREKITELLRQYLPEYMLPAVLTELEQIPLTGNGKVDRRALPEVDMAGLRTTNYIPPQNKTEAVLCGIWQEVLGIERVGTNDNFFELGGHSLRAVQVVTRVHKELGVKLELRELFNHPKIATLGKVVEAGSADQYESIERCPEQPLYELSHVQRRLWILDRLEPGQTAYNIPMGYILEGRLDIPSFKKAFEYLISRHEILRTVFEQVGGEPRQRILSMQEQRFTFEVVDLQQYKDKETRALQIGQRESAHQFSLSEGPLVRAVLMQMEAERFMFLFTLHHIITDGWSMEVLTREVLSAYESYRRGEAPSLQPKRIQYKDYASWQNKLLRSNASESHRKYWLNRLSGELPVLELLPTRERPRVRTYNGSLVQGALDASLTKRIKELALQQGASLFMTLLASVKVLLYRYSGQEDIIAGTVVAGRDHKELEDQVGFYVNTLAIRNEVHGEERFEQLLQRVKENMLEAYAHQHYPFDRLVDELSLSRDMSRHPLFDVMVVLQNTVLGVVDPKTGSENTASDLHVSFYGQSQNISKFDLTFNFTEEHTETGVHIEYNKDIFEEDQIKRMLEHLRRLLEAIVANSQSMIGKLKMLSEQEEQQLLYDFNKNTTTGGDCSVIDLFEQQVNKTPDAIALVFEGRELTYKQLNDRANQIAHYLLGKGVCEGQLVGICVQRSLELISCILGVLKTGAGYVPVDPEYPTARIHYMLQDSGVNVLLSNTYFRIDSRQQVSTEVIELDKAGIWIDMESVENVGIRISKDNTAYVMYTSGSTGRPKGVEVTHGNVVSLVNEVSYVSLGSREKLLSTGSLSFDATTFEYWGMLLNGGCLVLCPQPVLLDYALLKELIIAQGITMMWFTAGWFNQLVETDITLFDPLKTILAGGDKLSAVHIRRLQQHNKNIEILNGYGPTENTTFSLVYRIGQLQENDQIPVGRPMENRCAYILDKGLQYCGIGIAGEICVGGAGLSRGYWRNRALTESKFIEVPGPGPLYRTGDIGYWLPDGNIAFLGRKDEQIKIRGYRIELGEIESALQKIESVKQCVVTVRQDSQGDKQLIGYIVPQGVFNKEEIIEALQKQLPEYMVPAVLTTLDQIPLTVNGKVDRKALPEVDMAGMLTSGYEAPRNKTEELLCSIWQEVLGVERIGINDNFFELGGHSLKAVQVVSRVHRELGIKLELRELFNHPFIAELNIAMEGADKALYESIDQCPGQPYYELSHAQRRLWILDSLEPGHKAYNMPGGYILEGPLEINAFKKAFEYLINRHEILRTVFVEVDGKPCQRVLPMDEQRFVFEVIELQYYDDKELRVLQLAEREAAHRFNLTEGPLVRAILLQLEAEQYVFLFTLHHIISDGWSMGVLTKEVLSAYKCFRKGEAPSLPPLRIQYKDYATWQHKLLHSSVSEAHRQYWLNRFSGELPVLELPEDHSRGRVKTYNGGSVRRVLDTALTKKIKELALEHGASLFMVLVASVKAMLCRYTGQNDIIVGTTVAGRDHRELEDQIGFYVNTLALRSDVYGEESFQRLLSRIKENMLSAYAHQAYPFDQLVDELSLNRDMSRHPLFDVLVELINTDLTGAGEHELEGISVSGYGMGATTSKFDLCFRVMESKEELQLELEYNSDLYNRSTVMRIIDHLERIVQEVSVDTAIAIKDLGMLAGAEAALLVNGFGQAGLSEYDLEGSIVKLFEQKVVEYPEAIAVHHAGREYSYTYINEQSNKLAHWLRREYRAEEGKSIGLMLERSELAVIGVLGIMKSGGVLVPVDRSHPAARKKHLLTDAGCVALVTVSTEILEIDYYQGGLIALDVELDAMDTSVENADVYSDNQRSAYILYTSGSTGRPKGVEVSERSLLNYLLWSNGYYFSNERGYDFALFTSLSFDLTLTSIVTPLLRGDAIHVYEEEEASGVLQKIFSAGSAVRAVKLTPSHIKLLGALELTETRVQVVIVGGEALGAAEVRILKGLNRSIKIYNEYGPTEATIGCVVFDVDEQDQLADQQVPIGRCIGNSYVYVLGEGMELQPVGCKGELWIGGVCLSKGYYGNEEQTALRFKADPYRAGERIYATGDIVRYRQDGVLEYYGRKDDQVKIRGHRIELGEVESALQHTGLVKQSVVIVREDNKGDKQLIGYIVPEGKFSKAAITEQLRSALPEYMIPAVLTEMQQIPLTVNGKTDRRALPEADLAGMRTTSYVAPRNKTEELLCSIWQEVLGIEQVGIYDDFFELGGDSIITIQTVSRVRRLGYKLQAADVFEHPTIAALSQVMRYSGENETVKSEQGELTGEAGLLPIQYWFFESGHRVNDHFNQVGLFKINKQVSESELQEVFSILVSYHDALRFRYGFQEGMWKQYYGSKSVRVQTEQAPAGSDEQLQQHLGSRCSYWQQQLSIGSGELIQVVLMKTGDEQEYNRLFIVVHHLAIDGVSWRIILEDLEVMLSEIKNGVKPSGLGEKGSSYRQWQNALMEYASGLKVMNQLKYWEQVQQRYEPLTTDTKYHGVVLQNDVRSEVVWLDTVYTDQLLQGISTVYHTGINDILLSALSQTVCNWQQRRSVVIGLEGHGREESMIGNGCDVSRTVGWFTTLYPVLLEIEEGADRTNTLIRSIKEQLRQVPDKGMSYGALKYLHTDNTVTNRLHGTCWDVVFNYLGQADNITGSKEWLIGAEEDTGDPVNGKNVQRDKLEITSMVAGGRLILSWRYSELHFQAATIKTIANDYIERLQQIIDHCVQMAAAGISEHTPSDFGLGQELSYYELDKLTNKDKAGSVTSVYRVSDVQQGLLFHGLYDKDSSAYIVQMHCDLKDLDVSVFIKSWDHLIKHHSILRTGFHYEGLSIPVQCVYESVSVQVEQADFRWMDEQEQAAAVNEYILQDQRRPFTFREVPLMRLGLLQIRERDYKMIWTFHHMILDGWSVPVLMEEFLQTYESLLQGAEPFDKEQDHYEDYIRYLEKRDKQNEAKYWKEYLSGIGSGTLLPIVEGAQKDRTKGVGVYEAAVLVVDTGHLKMLRDFVQRYHITVNTLMQGIWSYLLHRYSGSQDVVYGVTVSGRPEEMGGIEQRVGLFINTIPVRVQIKQSDLTGEWLGNVQRQQVTSRKHQYSSLSEIKEWIGLREDLFDTILVFENYPVSEVLSRSEWSLKTENVAMSDHANYPLIVTVSEAKEIYIRFDYNSALIKGDYVKQIAQQFKEVLEQIVECRAERLEDILFPGTLERMLLVNGFGQAGLSEYDLEGSIVKLFEQKVVEYPEAIAVHHAGREYSYTYINEQSNKLAHWLRREYRAEEGKSIGLMLERSELAVIGVLGIMKSGGVLVPVDRSHPAVRKKHLLTDAGCVALVTVSTEILEIDYYQGGLIALDVELNAMDTSVENADVCSDNQRSAYILYTSGSTGRPKGVEVSERSLLNYLLWSNGYYFSNERGYDFALFTSLSFDLTLTSILTPLLRGDAIHVYEEEEASGVLQKIFSAGSAVRAVKLTPSHIKLLGALELTKTPVQVVIVGGEALGAAEVRILKGLNRSIKIYNEYGPTEATIGCVVFDVDEQDQLADQQVPIGRCIGNSYVYVLGEGMELQPVGCKGELWIGGVCLSKGYYGNEEQTALRFKADPYRAGERIYATGDIVRYRQDGVLEYYGRKDDQVKIRGHRIELGEIESALQRTGLVKQSVVIVREDNKGDKQLIGYIVPEGEFNKAAITEQLRSALPEYMIPAVLTEMQQIPLTVNGKIDRGALPEADLAGMRTTSYVAPRNKTEELLCSIWQEVLGVEQVGIYDDFFELGGHSLKAVQVVSRIHKDLGVKLELRQLFNHSQIAALCKMMETNSAGQYEAIEPCATKPYYELSHAQRRLWIQDRLEADQTAYNIPGGYILKGPLEVDAFKKAFEYLISRHEILRTVFEEVGGEPRQRVLTMQELGFVFEVIDLQQYDNKEERAFQIGQREAAHHFNLSRGPLVRAILLQLEPARYVFLFTLHHIISDGWSMGVLTREVLTAYESYCKGLFPSLPSLSIQYKDYANWQNNLLRSERGIQLKNFWKNALYGYKYEKSFSLKANDEDDQLKYDGDYIGCVIGEETYKRIKKVINTRKVSLFMLFQAALHVVLYRSTGKEDIVIGTEDAARDHLDLENQIGFFINPLAIRTKLSGALSFEELLDIVQRNTLEVFAYKEYPFDLVIQNVKESNPYAASELFDIVLSVQNFDATAAILNTNIEIEKFDSGDIKSVFGLIFTARQTDDEIYLEVLYRKSLYNKADITFLTNALLKVLDYSTHDMRIKLDDILLDEREGSASVAPFSPDELFDNDFS